LNQELQSRIFAEIENFNVETIASSTLLDFVVLETARKYPPVRRGTRSCTKDCSIRMSTGEVFKFLKGDSIHFPFDLIQNDKKIFDHPEVFNPFRFTDPSAHQFLLAFGSGPRSCLGTQLVLLQTKLLISSILRRYSLKPCDKSPKSFYESADQSLLFELSERK
jgi:cytochrome P450